MKPILEIKNISKKFRIRHEQQAYLNFRDALTSLFSTSKGSIEEFWALNDVSFNVMPGDTIGILGKNGAGKSTLLKILSKITPPTTGSVISRGRIASLLEVGTGFHPELSGKENIYLNGSILGMTRKEITAKFDEIVDFAGVLKFIDTPLKHYSSGMQLRLAFAVAAFLEPEILIIDEVLAVGDYEFQQKCLGKMESVTKSGRTILFVSHNISALSALCSKGVLLANGKLVQQGKIGDVIHEYMMHNPSMQSKQGVEIQISYTDPDKLWTLGSQLIVDVICPKAQQENLHFADLAFYTLDGTKLFALQSHKMLTETPGIFNSKTIRFSITNPGFSEKELRMDLGIKNSAEGNYTVLIENAATITPSSKNLYPYKASDTLVTPKASCSYL